jgi:hypothetical protein
MVTNADFIQLLGQSVDKAIVNGGGGAGGQIVAVYDGFALTSHGERVPLPPETGLTVSICEITGRPDKVIYGITDRPTMIIRMNYSGGFNLLIEDYARFPNHIELHGDIEEGRYRIVQADTQEELDEYGRSLNVAVSRSLSELLKSQCPNGHKWHYCPTHNTLQMNSGHDKVTQSEGGKCLGATVAPFEGDQDRSDNC